MTFLVYLRYRVESGFANVPLPLQPASAAGISLDDGEVAQEASPTELKFDLDKNRTK